MKFRIIVSILTVAIVALFLTTVYYSTELRVSLNNEQELTDSLKTSQGLISAQKDSLETVMKSLNVWETSDQEKRAKQLSRSKYNIIILAEAKYEDLYDLISFSVNSGFDLIQARKEPRGVPTPRIFYYRNEHKSVAEEFAKDLKAKFPNISDFNIERGNTPRSGIDLIVYPRFNY